MTEQPPSAEALRIVEPYPLSRENWMELARRIDGICEQRVSAETERWQQRDRQRLEQIDRLQQTVQSAQSAQAERPAPSAVVDYTEWAREIIGRSCGEVVDYIHGSEPLVNWRVNERLIVNIAAALTAVASAAAMRAFGQRVWSDTEEVAYQAGATDERAALQLAEAKVAQLSETAGEDYSVGYESGTKALLARLLEPDVREEVIEALRKSRWPSIKKLPPLDDLAPGIRKMYERQAAAALTKIAEMLK